MISKLNEYSHKRYNILTGEWVLVSPHRAKRPWQGQEEDIVKEIRPSYDENCYLCTGNTRANGAVNPNYKDTFVFTNDFAAIQKDVPLLNLEEGVLKAETEQGICKVICFSADHSKTLADMSVVDITKVVQIWKQEYNDLAEHEFVNYIQIFENKGATMGCSNPHPHGQIWAQSSIPNEVVKKNEQQQLYYNKYKQSLLEKYVKQELATKERVIYENEAFVLLIPFWAVWPFETMIVPKRQQQHIGQLSLEEEELFADCIAKITQLYDKVFNCSFPYSSGIHQAPTNKEDNSHWHWHMSFYPPLLRSASVKKFMVGYEMFGMPQRDITAESVAERLRDLI